MAPSTFTGWNLLVSLASRRSEGKQETFIAEVSVMNGELLTRATIWIALLCYALAASAFLLSQGRTHLLARARWAWSVGCAVFLTHVYCAFQFYHSWSHAAAFRDTARQTAETLGWNWGGGLFVSYAFTAAWILDVGCWWWQGLASYLHRPKSLMMIWHGFFFFIVFNGTVIFEEGAVRGLGLMLCSSLLFLGWRSSRRKQANVI